MATGDGKKKDPLEQIQGMIDAALEKHEEKRSQREAESKDPMKRLAAMIDESVGKHFEAFAKGLEDGGDEGEEDNEDQPGFLERLFGDPDAKKTAKK